MLSLQDACLQCPLGERQVTFCLTVFHKPGPQGTLPFIMFLCFTFHNVDPELIAETSKRLSCFQIQYVE